MGADPDLLDLDILYDDRKNVQYGEDTPFSRVIVNKDNSKESREDIFENIDKSKEKKIEEYTL